MKIVTEGLTLFSGGGVLIKISQDLAIKEVEAFCQFSKIRTWYISTKYYTNFNFGSLYDTYTLFNIIEAFDLI
jgi:hypothetical protein